MDFLKELMVVVILVRQNPYIVTVRDPYVMKKLRIPNYLNQLQGQLLCANYQASSETIVNGCVCTEPSGNCNQRNKTWNHQMQQVLSRREDELNFCYSLHARNDDEPITENVYKKSSTCEGHFCFASLSTREMVVETEPLKDGISSNSFIGVSKQRFELLAGCLKVDDDNAQELSNTPTAETSDGTPIEFIGEVLVNIEIGPWKSDGMIPLLVAWDCPADMLIGNDLITVREFLNLLDPLSSEEKFISVVVNDPRTNKQVGKETWKKGNKETFMPGGLVTRHVEVVGGRKDSSEENRRKTSSNFNDETDEDILSS
ncbi:hypothetical protein Mgra_00001332 [Meloidogyne graminicola]|uniref:Uncharacterized protein n=1 Tax=Meloidogyne graminicola TaxID=189291 RepID=A0A8T0A0M8_9BILA|nr:hypothetical protein Mgra_00001332 [Meloidogyne graminicola]